jgi:hypothetical protein
MPIYDFNDAPPQQGGGDTMPPGVYRVKIELRPGGSGDDGMLKIAKNMATEMLDLKFVVSQGAYAGKRFFENWVTGTQGTETEGIKTAISITRARVRASLESAFGFAPDDASDEANKARGFDSWADLNGLEIVVRLGIKKQQDYADKNIIQEIITPADKIWFSHMKDHPRVGGQGAIGPKPLQSDLDDEIPF